jgi:Tol biopolymer transport system component
VLPGGTGLIFTVWTGKSFNDSRIEAIEFASGRRKVLVEGGTGARYLPSGQIAYARNGTLFVVGFDAKRLEVKGTPVPVIEGVQTGASNGDGVFDVSSNGTLVFQPGTFGATPRNLVWMDRTGKTTNITPEVKPYAMVSMSRDGKRVPLVLQTSTFDVWVYDVERDTFTRASFGGDDYRPFFSPAGTLLAYDSSKSGSQQVFVKHGIAGTETAVTDGPEMKELYGWTPDGKEVIYGRQNKDTRWDLYAAAVEGDHKVRPLVVAQFNQNDAALSPDGKWLAYVSDESGQREVFVQAMNDPDTRAQISSEGGKNPRWAPSGNELIFLSKTRVMSVKFAPGGRLHPGKPVLLFEDKKVSSGYTVAPDGRLVAVRQADVPGTENQINVVPHWFEDLKKEAQK